MRMAELKCKNGTVIQISDETEQELKKAFDLKPSYKDSALEVFITENAIYPISIDGSVTRGIKDTEAFIVALQEVVAYCKQHKLGI